MSFANLDAADFKATWDFTWAEHPHQLSALVAALVKLILFLCMPRMREDYSRSKPTGKKNFQNFCSTKLLL